MLLNLHAGLANSAMLFALALAIWAFFRYFRGQGVDGSYLGAVVICELLFIVQGVIGLILFGGGARAGNMPMHILYGIVALISFPAFFAYIRGRDSKQEMLLWGFIALFVFGLTIRARMVAA